MSKQKVFIDGQAGTVGLSIREHLFGMSEVEVLSISDELRKDVAAKTERYQEADLVVLCLPDAAAREAVSIAGTLGTDSPRILDASTAHRVAEGWTYGFPEMVQGQSEKIAASERVANPGCYPTGAVSLIRPLVDAGILSKDFPLSINAVSGYSGGGRQLIEAMEGGQAVPLKVYGLNLEHKHVPEITKYSGLDRTPIFVPTVANYFQGMIVSLPLHLSTLPENVTARSILDVYQKHYQDMKRIHVIPEINDGDAGYLDPQGLNKTNDLDIRVYNNGDRVVALARLDNLGMGAAGTAVVNLKLMLGV